MVSETERERKREREGQGEQEKRRAGGEEKGRGVRLHALSKHMNDWSKGMKTIIWKMLT